MLARPAGDGARRRRCAIRSSARKWPPEMEPVRAVMGVRWVYASRIVRRIASASAISAAVASGERPKLRTPSREVVRRLWGCGVTGAPMLYVSVAGGGGVPGLWGMLGGVRVVG